VPEAQPRTVAVSETSQSQISFVDDVWVHLCESLGAQSYYAVGLALQKGLPYLLIPLLIRLYGEQNYASYVLFYSSSLMYGNFISAAIPNSIIAFWYTESDKVSLSWTYMVLLLTCQIALALVSGGGVFWLFGRSFGGEQAALLTILGLAFALLYNFNTFLTGVCRARNDSKRYCFAQIVAGFVLVSGLLLVQRRSSLTTLIAMFMLSLACQNLCLLDGIRRYLRKSGIRFDSFLARRVLLYSLPLIPHVGATLFYFWIDKYLVRLNFSAAQFSQFTISLQYAFAQTFFGQVFAMHTFPLICKLVAERNESKLRSVIRAYNSVLVILGVAWIAGILLVQHVGFQLRVNASGFVVLGCAILVWNLASNYINVLWARYKTKAVAAIIITTGGVLIAILWAGCVAHNLMLCYWSHLIWAAAALFALGALERSQRNASSGMAAAGEVAPRSPAEFTA